MAIAQYRILDVTDDGFLTVKWASADGPTVTYPVPFDDRGNPLAGPALEDWLAAQWEADIEERVDRSKSFATLRAARRPAFKSIQDKVDARRRQSVGGGNS
ncbi:MAG: hypothetical protein OXI64_02820 [Defluviicoccus sp.]|nr:hypothetical protein [Defluviicoccus sp.]